MTHADKRKPQRIECPECGLTQMPCMGCKEVFAMPIPARKGKAA